MCDAKKIDFAKLREAANSKWNINIKEARKGINGKCLSKDTLIIDEFFRNNKFIKMAIKIDKQYKKILKNSKGKKL
ncbi:hypothetical protein A2697_01935 [Candidatus Curtissbacteria bacterium RIFCSPHIGHO2_01_FULL_41_44]|uniref:Uncharacterized protein n=1 Tax=Candidatus Curtissbacteria bacterium RIFCSPLOWO2_01_FULL_42_50 TaxID=1797730 RepID=A0A1F5H415_9BACT|nr:MAG: hypothetical protein A2697_01935 [Candidatus Curtissbacteria bacterium RIFCSPHIGHO2_01_FULL_41_44]OGD96933.1 MAG: hypothetical protein A3E71_00775 [Candidatus Curtissbacteria bacterium RIFCSPHIGHO2_12_FULL_42_33]OGD98785.1 MAG: hypothetical protein A3B54_03810 [Candidatus Curtissbacteria bacterium RIFCSPLOWO2_01_FULL_42_50]OGE02205.1 MAG: hypothetical protein A3G16_00950 [Candidatus Curtissbacteria bacterium RIFCSPLOWO2_12_FULL_41_16]OGE11316.1 MAG: hypothetical protein A3H87_03740 [Can